MSVAAEPDCKAVSLLRGDLPAFLTLSGFWLRRTQFLQPGFTFDISDKMILSSLSTGILAHTVAVATE